MSDPRLRQLTIKTGVVKRLSKEKTVYEKEVVTEQNRIEKLKAQGSDDHAIRKQEEVLQESMMMVPDCQRRLAKAFAELSDMIKNEEELKESPQYVAAVAVLEDAKVNLPNSAQ
ncbi:tubulin-specific chaperone A [Toxorhynchites rutilus septentrionalis]|uniref:tubulin-specific chaperone A n=1 Tax=Toxorhynchites rutilus septentrionalis TaxID=329112 RepID=UPI0024791B03|nr:tubulin-specific chaperone A [Toxorhynchites rutilus septentrionalis]XP_055634838.1 tubulin-specific chaperone A [Toxorhynchites rutilus septentrionalis]